MNPESPYGEPQYSKLAEQISDLRQRLNGQLDPAHQRLLEQLSDTYIQQGSAMLPDAFADGFWTAVELMLEYYRRKSTSQTKRPLTPGMVQAALLFRFDDCFQQPLQGLVYWLLILQIQLPQF